MNKNSKKIYLAFGILGIILTTACFPIVPNEASAAIVDWQKSGTIVPRWSTDFGSETFKESVRNLAATHANYATLHIPLSQSNIYSTDVARGWNAPTDQSLIDGIQFIHSLDMHVALKFQVLSNDNNWSAHINPSNRAEWFTNYGNILDAYTRIAEANGVEEIIIGTELISMTSDTVNATNTSRWLALISRLRGLYSGELSYSANWGGDDFTNEKAHIEFWSALDYIGIAAYFNLYGDGSISSLTAQWDNWKISDIKPLADKWGKPILFTEIGYKATAKAHEHPWMWWDNDPPDENAQARNYEALFSYWTNQSFMIGVHLWNWSSDPIEGLGNNDYTPQHKLAEGVMMKWFAGNSPPPPPPPQSGVIDIWWPGDGQTVSGVQPFKALLQNTPIESYSMFWQVDHGQLNAMQNDFTDYPHKEASVDVDPWTWNRDGPYLINFVAKNASGMVIAERSANIMIYH